jgi:hypothetical protein
MGFREKPVPSLCPFSAPAAPSSPRLFLPQNSLKIDATPTQLGQSCWSKSDGELSMSRGAGLSQSSTLPTSGYSQDVLVPAPRAPVLSWDSISWTPLDISTPNDSLPTRTHLHRLTRHLLIGLHKCRYCVARKSILT